MLLGIKDVRSFARQLTIVKRHQAQSSSTTSAECAAQSLRSECRHILETELLKKKMSFLSKVFVALGLLCIITCKQKVEAQNFSVEYVDNRVPIRTKVHYGMTFGTSESLLYMICNNRDDSKFNCRFNLKMLNGTEKHCSLNLLDTPDPHINYVNLYGGPMTGSTAVLEWAGYVSEYFQNWVTLVDMDSCKLVRLTFPNEETPSLTINLNFRVLAYHDGIHILLDGEEKCDELAKSCLLRYDYNGTPIGQPVPFPMKPRENLMVANWMDSRSGLFFTGSKAKGQDIVLEVSHMSYNGSEMSVLANHSFPHGNLHEDLVMRSQEDGYLSYCLPENRGSLKIRCVQFERKRQVMDVEVTLGQGHRVLDLFHRLNGGLIIVYLDCAESWLFDCKSSHVKVKVVDAEGEEVIGSAELAVLELERVPTWFEYLRTNHLETDTEHCFYFAYVIEDNPKLTESLIEVPFYGFRGIKVRYLKRCMSKEDVKPDVNTRYLTVSPESEPNCKNHIRTCMNECMNDYVDKCSNKCI